MSASQAMDFLDAVSGHLHRSQTSSADRPVRLATVDPAYSPFASYPSPTPAARVTFDGEDTLSGKAYPVAHGFIPHAGQRVFMLPVGSGYLISGAVNAQTPQGFWQDAAGVDAGVELGGGSYFDTAEGLYLETDATVQGQLQVGSRGLRVPEVQAGVVRLQKPTAAASQSQVVTFPKAWPAGTPVYMPSPNHPSAAGANAYLMLRAHVIGPTGFTVVVLKTDAVLANFTLTDFDVHWMAVGFPAS